jgi:hypothetical protein
MIFRLITFLAFLFTTPVSAQWSANSIKIMKSKMDYIDYTKPAFISYWGGVKRFLKGEGLNGEEYNFSSTLLKNELEVYIYKSKQKQKNPLIVFFPGIYGNFSGQLSPYLINIFEKGGYHVFSFPNFLHESYIKAQPLYTEENTIKLDSLVALELIEKAIKEIGRENISHVSFVGESLGAFLAASTGQYINQFNELKKMVKNILLLWPPLNLPKTLMRFDENIIKTRETHNQCNYFINFYRKFMFYLVQEKPHEYSETDEMCLDAEMYHGAFLKGVEKAYNGLKDINDNVKGGSPKTFREFFERYNPYYLTILKDKADELLLKNFINSWKQNGSNVKVASSIDDFINSGEDWKDISEKFLFDWGSHCAPLALEDWNEILLNEVL